jgi:hypothetical protein
MGGRVIRRHFVSCILSHEPLFETNVTSQHDVARRVVEPRVLNRAA